ncbi:MAG: glycosyltransferase family 39 protein [Deltaproteobacteria bacterium]|nr:glycosyltransferase family 39 protein [Deltaproteobacteria bacterium]
MSASARPALRDAVAELAAAPRRAALSRRTVLLAALGAVLALAVALRLTGLTAQSLWYDEGSSLLRSGGASWSAWAADLTATHASERYQPLYFALLRAWRGVAGDGEAALRGLSVVCGVAAVAVIGAAGGLVGGARHGVLAALLLAASAFAVTYSQEVRPYALLMLLAALQLWAVLHGVARPQRSGAARRVAWLVGGLGAYAGPFAILASAALAAAHLAVTRRWRAWLAWWGPVLLLALPLLVYLALSLVDPAPPRAEVVNPRQQPLWQNALFVAYGLIGGASFGPPPESLRGGAAALYGWLPALAALAAAAAICAGLAWRARRAVDDAHRRLVRLLALTLAVGVVAQLAFAALSGFNWQPRHACALLLPLVLLAPLAVTAARGAAARAGALALAALLVANGLSLAHYFGDPAYQRDDYRAAAAYLRGAAGPDTAVVVLWGRPELLAYYGAAGAIDGTLFGRGYLAQRLDAAVGAHRDVLLVLNRAYYFDDDPAAALRQTLAAQFAPAGSASLPAFEFHRFRRIGGAAGEGH